MKKHDESFEKIRFQAKRKCVLKSLDLKAKSKCVLQSLYLKTKLSEKFYFRGKSKFVNGR